MNICRPSLALNPCKKYQQYKYYISVYSCSCVRNKYPCKSEFVWNVHIQVMLKVISFSVLNMHELNETCQSHRFWNSQTVSQMYTWPNEWAICPENGFQTPITARCELPLNRNSLNFPWLLLKFPDLLLFLTGKRMNFPSMATISHTNILIKSEILIFFSNNRIEIGGHQ